MVKLKNKTVKFHFKILNLYDKKTGKSIKEAGT